MFLLGIEQFATWGRPTWKKKVQQLPARKILPLNLEKNSKALLKWHFPTVFKVVPYQL